LLLVDDDPGLLKLLGMRLVSEGYSVVTAESGPEETRRFTDRHGSPPVLFRCRNCRPACGWRAGVQYLVDDDPGLLKLLGMRLVSEGYSVVTAESGPEALRPPAANAPVYGSSWITSGTFSLPKLPPGLRLESWRAVQR
jgi:CheY-like chemotaxis protein